MISTKTLLPLALAALAAAPCLLVPRPVRGDDRADDEVVLETAAGRFVRRGATLALPCGVVVERDADGVQARRDGVTLLELRHEREEGRTTRTRRGARETAYLHDDAGLLSGVLGSSRTFVEHRRFSAGAGLRTAFERDGAAEVWTRAGDGRLVAAGERRVRHDEAGRVTEVIGPPGDVGPTWRVRYLRDARGRVTGLERATRTGAETPDAVTTRAARPRDGRRWVRLPGEPAPVAYAEGERWTYLVSDADGSALLYLDAAGAPVASADFSPWGELEAVAGEGAGEGPGDRPVVWRGGRVVDPEHLAWPGGRAYSPSLGQHLEPPYAFDPEARGSGLAGRLDGR